MKKITFIKVVEVLNMIPKINISTKQNAEKTFDMFKKLSCNKYGYAFIDELKNNGIYSGFSLMNWLGEETVQKQLINDIIGKQISKRIKYPKEIVLANEFRTIYNIYKDYISVDENCANDNSWVIRTQFGTGPVVFINDVPTDEDRHNIRRWYAWQYKINYFQVRECTYNYWINNPDYQVSTTI